MFDLKLPIARIRRTLDVPKDFIMPWEQSLKGDFDKEEASYRMWNNLQCYFAPLELLPIYQYTQKKYLLDTLIWSEKYYASNEVPILAFSLRSFIECAANYHSGISEIEAAFDSHGSMEKYGGAWESYIMEDLYPLIMSLVYPKTTKHAVISPAGSVNIEVGIKEVKEVREQYAPPTLEDNETLANTKSSPLKPVNILTKLKKFEKHVAGIHPAYDLLSEATHPNSYPITSQVTQVENLEDASKPSVTWRFDGNPAMSAEFYEFQNIPTVINACANAVLTKEKTLGKLRSKLRSELKVFLRPLANEVRTPYFPSTKTVCFCRSGKLYRKCCGRAR